MSDRLAANPFAGFGPDEWGRPFGSIDSYQAIPACTESMKLHPDERRFVLEAALAYIAGKKNDEAKPLLQRLIGEGDTSAMLALACISPEPEAADLMHKAADAGDPNAMMLFGMAQMTGQGVPKNEIDGGRPHDSPRRRSGLDPRHAAHGQFLQQGPLRRRPQSPGGE
jgi:hypothetical protein